MKIIHIRESEIKEALNDLEFLIYEIPVNGRLGIKNIRWIKCWVDAYCDLLSIDALKCLFQAILRILRVTRIKNCDRKIILSLVRFFNIDAKSVDTVVKKQRIPITKTFSNGWTLFENINQRSLNKFREYPFKNIGQRFAVVK